MAKEKKSVEEIISKMKPWVNEVTLLREIVLSTGFEETIKWGGPTYVDDGKNVLGIGAFKKYATIWLYHGVFLSDPKKVLINAQEGITKGLRQWRFTSIEEINPALVKNISKRPSNSSKKERKSNLKRKKQFPFLMNLKLCLSKTKN